MTKAKTTIAIDEELLKETDKIAQELKIPRRQVVSLALEDFIRRYRNRQLLERINEAYSDEPDPDEIGTLKIMHSHQRNLAAYHKDTKAQRRN
jgi:metal-responsive CopG/Arc/MetJ family transcriptional regulator